MSCFLFLFLFFFFVFFFVGDMAIRPRKPIRICTHCLQLEKKYPFSTSGERFVREVYFLVPGSLYFKHARISLPLRGLRGNFLNLSILSFFNSHTFTFGQILLTKRSTLSLF